MTRDWARAGGEYDYIPKPYDPTYTHYVNWIGHGDNAEEHRRIFAINPNYLLLTDYYTDGTNLKDPDPYAHDQDAICSYIALYTYITHQKYESNCFWELLLSRLPVVPPDAAPPVD